MNLLDLASKKDRFTDEEIAFIKKHTRISDFKVKYVFYKHENPKHPIGYIIDQMPNSPRRSGYENRLEIFSIRNLVESEYEELIQNYGKHHRRFICYWYDTIDHLQKEDALYNVATDSKFVLECVKRGYTDNSFEKMLQMELGF